MNLSLMSCQMIRVISSPSSSTTGFLTLIFCLPLEALLDWRRDISAFSLLDADIANEGREDRQTLELAR